MHYLPIIHTDSWTYIWQYWITCKANREMIFFAPSLLPTGRQFGLFVYQPVSINCYHLNSCVLHIQPKSLIIYLQTSMATPDRQTVNPPTSSWSCLPVHSVEMRRQGQGWLTRGFTNHPYPTPCTSRLPLDLVYFDELPVNIVLLFTETSLAWLSSSSSQ